jgi:hypothetical protein
LIETKTKDPHEAGLLFWVLGDFSDDCPAEDAQHREAAEPALIAAAEPVSTVVEARGGVVMAALVVIQVGEQAAP